jgi:mono/diheme cytochrome c family protein
MIHRFATLLVGAAFFIQAGAASGAVSAKVRFNRDIRPILAENCLSCHGFDPKHREAGLRLDTFEGATRDNDGTRAIVPGDVAKSEAIKRILSTDKEEVMPPPKAHKKALTTEQIDTLKRWVEQGAPYEAHWAFVPPVRPAVPSGQNALPVDAFIRQELAKHGLPPSGPASAATLIRRASLDLTGLPPTPAEVEAFEKDFANGAEAAYARLIDRLLASPHYGERWARWWLDQARYADSNGYSIDAPRQIWKFRDWVIDALNGDMPFDQFTLEQIAGDLLPQATESQKIATGFHRNTQINQEGGIDPEQFRIDSVFDRVATTGTVWLGLSVGCAQCHDHKFDPIEQKEYYRMFAFLNNQEEPMLKVFDPGVDVKALTAEFKELEGRLKAAVAERISEVRNWEQQMSPAFRKTLSATAKKAVETPAEKRTLEQNLALFSIVVNPSDPLRILADRHKELDNLLNQGTTTLVLKELAKPRKTTVFIKGDFTRPSDEVAPGVPAVLHPLEGGGEAPNRLDLAKWLVSKKSPLTARVIVNRVWQQYFGRGIVETENDFGLQGSLPSHPELLDWLAVEFMEKGWSLKALHRLVVMSATYRQSSANRADLREQDPNNILLARQHRLRLDAEVVRDVALKASGLLSAKIGGPSVFPPIPDGVMGQGQVKRAWTVSNGEDKYRRGMYTFVYRASPPPELTVFDAPEGFNSCTRRIRSNTPLQALTLLNDPGFFEFATALDKRIQTEGLEHAFKRCTGRAPREGEVAVLKQLDTLSQARALLNLDETITRE